MVATFINWAAQWRRQKILPGNQLVQFFQTVKKSLQIGENKKIDTFYVSQFWVK
jgi:proline dehydrogenase